MKQIIGIDLGTTYSLVSTLQDGQPVVLPNGLGELLTPSAVSVDGDTVLVGAPARARATTHPRETALAFKRDMGTAQVVTLGKRSFTPQELSALVLRELKRDAEAALGHPVEEAVITVPAYFGDAQRAATRDAGALAGLQVERIINEPTAAALAYGLHARHREVRVIVLDLGGGTFDVTLLQILEGVIEIQSSSGDTRLGGEDFDDALAGALAERIKATHGVDTRDDARAWARLREAAEQAKRRLSTAERTTLACPQLPAGRGHIDFETTLTRAEAEDIWRPVLTRIQAPIQRCLRDAGVKPGDVEEILLVGGSTRMPAIARIASQLFGRLPLRTLPPDEAVAMGACVQAGLKSGDVALGDMVVTDVAPFTLGTASSTRVGGRRVDDVFTPILERGTVIPASRVERFCTAHDRQEEIEIEVYQGEHSMCRDNRKLGSYMLRNLPPRPAGELSIDVRFTYDLNGILEVDTNVVGTDRTESMVIENSPGRLSRKQLEEARARMAKLKFHPREALPNATVLGRADALFVELVGEPRDRLGHAIARFRAVLESQDRRRIDEAREELQAVLASCGRVRTPE